MATNAAHDARIVLKNVERIVAVELLAGAQGIDFRREQLGVTARMGTGTQAAYALIREHVPFLEHDAPLSPLIEAVVDLVADGRLVSAVEAVI
jgi:histidine ammonia-lyase